MTNQALEREGMIDEVDKGISFKLSEDEKFRFDTTNETAK